MRVAFYLYWHAACKGGYHILGSAGQVGQLGPCGGGGPWELERFLYLLVMLTILTGVIIVIRTDSVPSYSIVILVEFQIVMTTAGLDLQPGTVGQVP